MTTTQQDLIRVIHARRERLGDEWTTVAARGGITYQPIWRYLTGKASPRPGTKRGIERGLYWPPHAIDDYLAGSRGDELIDLPITQEATEDPVIQDLRDRWFAIRDDPNGGRAAADEWLLERIRGRVQTGKSSRRDAG